jgi:probable HAF family extracellular repeat protein
MMVEELEERLVPTNYTVVDLGGPSSQSFFPLAINALGQVAGSAKLTVGGSTDAAVWDNGTITDLGTPGGATGGRAAGINASGQVVGSMITAFGEAFSQSAFLWQSGTFTDLGTSATASSANAINDLGEIVGQNSGMHVGPVSQAFLYDNGQLTNLGSLGGLSDAFGINNAGQVVGESQVTGSPFFHAFLWQNGVMTDLGQLGTTPGSTAAFAINNAGQVVGISGNSAFLFDSTGMHDLGVPTTTSASANGINDSGTIVGQSDTYAFIDQNGVVTNLNSLIAQNSGWQLTSAVGINNAGQIVGTGWLNGQLRGFLLNPVTPSTTTPIPLFETNDPTFAPGIPVANDNQADELGVSFTTQVSGTVSAIQIYRGDTSSDSFAVHLWDANGNLLGIGQSQPNQGPGWITVNLDLSVHLNAGATYVASYFAPHGGYADNHNFTFQSRGPLAALQGVFAYGGGFPTQTFMNSNYWVGPVFQPDTGDAPTVTSLSENSDTASGGTVVTILGSHFLSTAEDIYFGDTKSLNFTVIDDNTIAALVPAHPASTVDVRVITAAGESATSAADQFTFTPLPPPAAPITLFETTDPTFSPDIPVANDTAVNELGVQFTVSVSGTVSAIQFYRGAASASGFTVHLWDAGGNLLASGTEAGNASPGWQTVTLDQVVELQANTTYVASYFTSDGAYADSKNYTFQTRGPLTALQGVYLYGGGFPNQTYMNSNYWVGPVFQPDTGTPPTVTALDQTTGTADGGFVDTIHGSHFLSSAVDVYFGDTKSLNFTVIDDNTIAALVPSHPASTVDVRVITAAGESLITPADQFTYTAPAPPAAPITLFETTDPTFSPAVPVVNDNQPVELGVKFVVFVPGSVSAIQFYRGAPSSSPFAVHLWDFVGDLLASGTAPGNAAPGWQMISLDHAVELQPLVTYIASYYTSDGGYAADVNFFTNNGISRGSLLALTAAGGEAGPGIPNGVYHYGQGGGFPDQSYLNSNYWVGPLFQPDASVGPPPILNLLSQNSAPTTGGGSTMLTIQGANFTPDAIAPTVWFGDVQAQIHIYSANEIIVSIPPHPAGTVDVRIITSAGESVLNPNDLFTYTL